MAASMSSQFGKSLQIALCHFKRHNTIKEAFRRTKLLKIREYSSATSFTERTHLCGELRAHHAGESVTLCGWLQFHRLSGAFIVLRDWHGSVQLLVPENKVNECRDFPLESVLGVSGQVRLRPLGQENKNMSTGQVEVAVEDIQLLNSCTPTLPFQVNNFVQVQESLRMKHRYLDLRLPNLQQALRLRSKFVMAVRKFLTDQHEFVEVETPTLFRRTPGGAREFLVPSHLPGKFYSLPQSPQQFKQLLMVGGLDRYFQIARCYRDESTKPDRQPEFTQIDLEMSFTTQDAVMSLVEQMLEDTWPQQCGQVSAPFPRMSYQEAMTRYGTDKPDLRLDWQIASLSPAYLTTCPPVFQPYLGKQGSSVQVLRIPGACENLSNNEIETARDAVLMSLNKADEVKVVLCKIKENGAWASGLGRHLDDTSKETVAQALGAGPSDLLIFAGGVGFQPHTVLGQARLKFASVLESKGIKVRVDGLKFVWVDTFPLFLPKEDGGEGLESAHHPFTAPHPDDLDLIFKTPELVRAQHYDLVLNGSEIGGGSIRIHNSTLQGYILTEVLKEDSSELEHLLEALNCGCPPHGGIALGLDRLMAIMVGAKSIREVIAFPKTQQGRDPLSNSPAAVSQSDLDFYNISLHISTDDTGSTNS